MATSTPGPRLLADLALHEAIRAYVGPRAPEVDACRCTLREGLAHLATLGAVERGVLRRDPPADFERMCEVTATVALDDMSQAFSLWAHRMAIEYLHQSDDACHLRGSYLPRLLTGEVLGSTSFASATANYLAGTPLPLTFTRRPDGGLVVNGRIAWASNLEAPFLSVAAAANADDPQDRVVFAYSESTPGLKLTNYPELLALQATASTSPLFEDAQVLPEQILTQDFNGFVGRVFPTFLMIQCSFCWGMSRRSLAEVEAAMAGPNEILREDFEALQARHADAEARLRSMATHADRTQIAKRDLLQLRLDFGRLAVDSVALEAKVAGGRGYMLHSGTSRRLREAAFLPVQAPTEVQLRWLLSRSE
ncbi:MAG: acyl-CoA dehydrogenase [Chloroflexi bacterium]|nr:acyl-CoA/acyl-ACP dehydrogenase [Chloroflexota bacterium]MQC19453.1 acyl-CoA dehydrogenase [Chloroflexota bacterium]